MTIDKRYKYLVNLDVSLISGVPTVIIPSPTYSQDVGGDITIPCSITASPTVISSQWTFTADGGSEVVINSGGRFTLGATNNDLTITTLEFNDAGTYKCKATNAAGTTEDTATLTVTGGS